MKATKSIGRLIVGYLFACCLNTGGIISARLTNVVAQVSMPANTAAFYRLVQLP